MKESCLTNFFPSLSKSDNKFSFITILDQDQYSLRSFQSYTPPSLLRGLDPKFDAQKQENGQLPKASIKTNHNNVSNCNEKKYSNISDKTRHQLIECVINNGEHIKQVGLFIIIM